MSAHLFQGVIDSRGYTIGGLRIAGWCVEASGNMPCARLVLRTPSGAVFEILSRHARPDIAQIHGCSALMCGFSFELDLVSLGRPLDYGFEVFALHEGGETPIAVWNGSADLPEICISDQHDFELYIQQPSSRIQNALVQGYVSAHVLQIWPDTFDMVASSACVLAYRLLENAIDSPALLQMFRCAAQKVRFNLQDSRPGLMVRWRTSVALAEAYLFFKDERIEDCLESLRLILRDLPGISLWPSSLTNFLVASFISGWLLAEQNNLTGAVGIWRGACGLLRFGSSVADLQNEFSYDELINAVRTAKECCKGAQLIMDGKLDFLKCLDLKNVAGPFGTLVDARNRSRRDV